VARSLCNQRHDHGFYLAGPEWTAQTLAASRNVSFVVSTTTDLLDHDELERLASALESVSQEELDWELRLVSNLSRAKALDDAGLLSRAFEYAAGLEDNIAALANGDLTDAEMMSTEFLARGAEEMQSVVQISSPAPVVADGPGSALDLVFEQLVLDAARRSFEFEKKHRALGAVRRAYRSHGVPASAIRQRASVRSGVYGGVFDFAVHNGRTV
jgi:hypothetical protein